MATIVQQTNGEKEIFKADEYTLVQQQLATMNNNIGANTSQLADIVLDVLHPPVPMLAAKGDGVTDDSAAIQNMLNSLIGKSGKVLLPLNNVYAIGSKLTIPDTIELTGTISTTYGHTGSDVPTTVLKWIGATNSTMLTFLRSGANPNVYGAKIHDITFDANNVAGVTVMDMTNAHTSFIERNMFTQFVNGIYISNNYYNTIRDNQFDYFTGIAINLDKTKGNPNGNTISNNNFEFRNANAKGVSINGGNANMVVFNHFELYGSGIQPVYIEGGNTQDNVVSFNRFEHGWNLGQSQTPVYAITISSNNGVPRDTKVIGNQFYLEETDAGGTVHYNYYYAISDQGFGTYCTEYIEDNLLPNGSLRQINGAIPIWKSDNAAYTASFNTTENAVQLTVNNSSVKYPHYYNIINAQKLRGKNLTVSALLKSDNIITTPRIEVFGYKGGDGTLANLGTYENTTASTIQTYNAGTYTLVITTFAVPSDCDNIYVNVNPNGNNTSLPANNNIYVKFVAISEKKAFKVNPTLDLVTKDIKLVYPTSARPTGTKGMMMIDSTLNKPIWFDGTNWRDSTGTIV